MDAGPFAFSHRSAQSTTMVPEKGKKTRWMSASCQAWKDYLQLVGKNYLMLNRCQNPLQLESIRMGLPKHVVDVALRGIE